MSVPNLDTGDRAVYRTRIPAADVRRRRLSPPIELIDPEGEGIYLLSGDEDRSALGVLMTAARILEVDWREVEHKTVFLYPKKDSDEWFEVPWTWWWRLRFNVRRFSPACYAYCTPAPTTSNGEGTL